MHKDLETRRAVLVTTYRRYLDADRAWTAALSETRAWFPASSRPHRGAIGDPDSPVRRLYERRQRALEQLEIARLMMGAGKRRLAARMPPASAGSVRIRLLSGRITPRG